MIVRAGDGSMHSLEVEWLLTRLLARLVGSAWLALAWLVTIDAAKIQPIRRRNEDESTIDGLGLKIDSISKAPRGMYVRCDVCAICTNERERMCQPEGDKQPARRELWFFAPHCFFLGFASQRSFTPM